MSKFWRHQRRPPRSVQAESSDKGSRSGICLAVGNRFFAYPKLPIRLRGAKSTFIHGGMFMPLWKESRI